MSTPILQLQTVAGQTLTIQDGIAAFRLEKEAYTPYSLLSATVYGTYAMETLSDLYRIRFLLDETEVHLGTVDTFQLVRERGVTSLRFSSRGLTAMLLHNQLEPGMHSGMSLNQLMANAVLPEEITWEQSSDTSNYLFVKENTSLWDGVVHLTYKLCQQYPFIRHANEIRMHLPDTYQTYSFTEGGLLGMGMIIDHSRLYSDYYMADVDGSYANFHVTDATAVSYGIVRTKYLPLDRQYLHDPEQALHFRRKFAGRARLRYYFESPGTIAAALGDRLNYGTLLTSAPITRICITGSASGTRTRLETYQDDFYPTSG